MFKRNLKHDELFISENSKVVRLAGKLYCAWNEQNGTDFLNILDEIESFYESEDSPTLKASVIAYALYLVSEVAHQR